MFLNMFFLETEIPASAVIQSINVLMVTTPVCLGVIALCFDDGNSRFGFIFCRLPNISLEFVGVWF